MNRPTPRWLRSTGSLCEGVVETPSTPTNYLFARNRARRSLARSLGGQVFQGGGLPPLPSPLPPSPRLWRTGGPQGLRPLDPRRAKSRCSTACWHPLHCANGADNCHSRAGGNPAVPCACLAVVTKRRRRVALREAWGSQKLLSIFFISAIERMPGVASGQSRHREFAAIGIQGTKSLGHEVEGGGAIPLLEKRKICFDTIVSTKKSK